MRSIVVALDPGLLALAQDGPAGYRDRFELVYRREAAAANAVWQADRREDPGPRGSAGAAVADGDLGRLQPRVAGYAVNLGAPSALQTALALRQAIWRKADPV